VQVEVDCRRGHERGQMPPLTQPSKAGSQDDMAGLPQ
jgi:hypothetical protein